MFTELTIFYGIFSTFGMNMRIFCIIISSPLNIVMDMNKVDAPKTNNSRDFSTRIGGVILEGDFSSQ